MLRVLPRLAPKGWAPSALRAYVVTDDKYMEGPGIGLVDKLVAAAEGGATMIQLRLKNQKTGTYVDLARATRTALDRFNPRPWLIIDDRLDVCLAAEADGLHIGDGDLSPKDARKWLGPDRILGVSTYSELPRIDEAIEAGADYVATGSLQASTTKKIKTIKGLDPIPGVHKHIDGRAGLVSIGGVDATLAQSSCAAGCDGAAAVSFILDGTTAEDVRDRTARLLDGAEQGVRSRSA